MKDLSAFLGVLAFLAIFIAVPVGMFKPALFKNRKTGEIPSRGKIVIGGIGVFVVAVIIAVIIDPPSEKGNSTDETAAKPVAKEEKKADTPVEKKPDYYVTTAQKLFADYEANEVATDERIAKRQVEMSGTVQAIDKDFMDNIVIHFRTSNQFMPARLAMEGSEKQKAIELKKGTKATVICKHMSRVVGSPSGRDCVFK